MSWLATCMMLNFFRFGLVEGNIAGIFWLATFLMLNFGRGLIEVNFRFDILTSNLKIIFSFFDRSFSKHSICFFN